MADFEERRTESEAEAVAGWLADAAGVDGPRALLIGIDFLRDPVLAAERCHQRFGPAINLSFRGPGRRVRRALLLGPDYNRAVLSRVDVARPAGLWTAPGPPGSAQAEIRHNYLATAGAEHACLARTVVPHLHSERVDGHFDAMRSIVADSVTRWPADQPVDLYALVRRVGLLTGVGLLFGETDAAAVERFGMMLADYHNANWRLGVRLGLGSSSRWNWPAVVLHRAEALRDFVGGWVDERSGCPVDQDLRAALAGHRGPGDRALTPERLAAHVNFIGFAAYETMSSALTWTLFLLALHPRVLGGLADELTAAGPVESMAMERLDALADLDGVVKEALRLIPPTPVLPWRTIRRWEVGGVKAKISVILNPHRSHRDPVIFPDPAAFRPERWASARPDPYQYLPFSAGPRRCPGYGFGTRFMKLALAAIVPRWRVELAEGMRIDRVYRGITMPRPGMLVRLRRQDHRFERVSVRGSIHDLVAL